MAHIHHLAGALTMLLMAGALPAQPPTHQGVIHNLTGSASSVVRAVGSDGQGNMVIGGTRTDALDLGTIVYVGGSQPLFLAKFAPDGTELWSRVAGSTSNTTGQGGSAVAVDGDGNIYFTGSLFAIQAHTFESTTLPAGPIGSVAKYSGSGALLWVKGFPGAVNAVAVDGDGTPFVGVNDSSIEKLDPANGNTLISTPANGNLMNVQFHNIVVDGNDQVIAQWGNKITKYTNDLVEVWSTPLTASLAETYRVSVDGSGTVWSSFYALFGTVDLDGTSYSNFPNGYIYSLDGATGDVLGCNVFSADGSANKPKEVLHAGDGNWYVNGDLAFNAAHIVKMDAASTVLWSVPTFDVQDMDVLSADCLVLGGRHLNDITLDGTTYTRPNASGQDNAMAAFLCTGDVGVDEVIGTASFTLYPDPASDHATLEGAEDGVLALYDAAGVLVRTQRVQGSRTVLSTAELANGLYLVRDRIGRSARLLVEH